MDPLLMRELVLIRDACNEIEFARSKDDISKVVRQLQEYISKVIVDHSVVPTLHKEVWASLSEQTGGEIAALVRQLCQEGLSSSERNQEVVRDVISADFQFWKQYTAGTEQEINKISNGQNAEKPADPTDIDRNALSQFIAEAIEGESCVEITDVKTASIGNSKATLLLTLAGNKVLPDEIVLRKDQAFNFLGTHVKDEYPALIRLYQNGVPVPQPFALESSGKVLDHPFLLCSKEPGIAVGTLYFPPPRDDKMLASLAGALAKIHTVPVNDLAYIGVNGPQREEYIQAEIEKYRSDWEALNTESPMIDLAFAWVREHIDDARGRFTLVHNDYSYHNILIYNSEVSAVLDWEFIHIGNPAADLAYFQIDTEKGAGFEFFLTEYERAGGVVPTQTELDFYYIWGHTRFAVMNMQTKIGLQRGNMKGLRPMMPTLHYMPKPMLAIGRKFEKLLAR